MCFIVPNERKLYLFCVYGKALKIRTGLLGGRNIKELIINGHKYNQIDENTLERYDETTKMKVILKFIGTEEDTKRIEKKFGSITNFVG